MLLRFGSVHVRHVGLRADKVPLNSVTFPGSFHHAVVRQCGRCIQYASMYVGARACQVVMDELYTVLHTRSSSMGP